MPSGADEEVAQIVAVVLLQPRQRVQHLRAVDDLFQPSAISLAASQWVAQPCLAGFDRVERLPPVVAATFGAERQREQPVGRPRAAARSARVPRRLSRGCSKAGSISQILSHSPHRDHDLAMRGWPPTRPVLPPCGTSAVLCSLASAQVRGRSRRSSPAAAPAASDHGKQVALLGDIGRDVGLIGHHIFADDGAGLCDQFGRQRWRPGAGLYSSKFSFTPPDGRAAQPVVDIAQPVLRNGH